jgi:hypothetical protein
MNKLIEDWIGKSVHVTLRATAPITIEGKLLKADELGILLEMPKGQTYIPLTAIVHISLD